SGRNISGRVPKELEDEERQQPERPGPAKAAHQLHQQRDDEECAYEGPALAGYQGMRIVWGHRPAWLKESVAMLAQPLRHDPLLAGGDRAAGVQASRVGLAGAVAVLEVDAAAAPGHDREFDLGELGRPAARNIVQEHDERRNPLATL